MANGDAMHIVNARISLIEIKMPPFSVNDSDPKGVVDNTAAAEESLDGALLGWCR